MEIYREELAWAAGFFDGEGSCCIKTIIEKGSIVRTRKYVDLSVSQVALSPLYRFQKAIGGTGKIYTNRPTPYWRSSKHEVVQAAVAMLWPFLCMPKRNQIIRTFKEVSEFDKEMGYKKNRGKAQHGTISMYNNYRCRCVPCAEAERSYRRELYWRNK